MKPELRQQARFLRGQGLSLSTIQTRVAVSKSTLSVWVRDIPLTEEQMLEYQSKATIAGSNAVRRKREERWARFKQEAIAAWPHLQTQPRFMFGLALYAGEGDKAGQSVGMSNSDPRLLRQFLEFLVLLGANIARVTIRVHIHEVQLCSDAERYWLRELGLAPSHLRKAHIAVSRASLRKRNTLKYGTCHVRLHNTELHRKILQWLDLAMI